MFGLRRKREEERPGSLIASELDALGRTEDEIRKLEKKKKSEERDFERSKLQRIAMDQRTRIAEWRAEVARLVKTLGEMDHAVNVELARLRSATADAEMKLHSFDDHSNAALRRLEAQRADAAERIEIAEAVEREAVEDLERLRAEWSRVENERTAAEARAEGVPRGEVAKALRLAGDRKESATDDLVSACREWWTADYKISQAVDRAIPLRAEKLQECRDRLAEMEEWSQSTDERESQIRARLSLLCGDPDGEVAA